MRVLAFMRLNQKKWLNPTVIGASIASFLSDFSHEGITVLLPAFLLSLGAPAFALGLVEGVSDGLASFSKLFSGYYSDKFGARKAIASLGYVACGVFPAVLAVATTWPMVLVGRAFGWLGKGVRAPPRDAILASSVEKKDLGKAFGLHRAADTLGAIASTLAAYFLIKATDFRTIFWLALIPGFLALVAFVLLVKEKKIPVGKAKPSVEKKFFASLKQLPRKFNRLLAAIAVFGASDFSHALLVLFAVTQLSPSMGFVEASAIGVLLYALRNVVYAVFSYPFGAWGDDFGRKKMLALGYGLAAVTFAGFAVSPVSLPAYALLFSLAGAYTAAHDALENALAGELVADANRGLAFGTLATVNGVGDFASSAIVGFAWTYFGFAAGFAYAAVFAAAGALALLAM